MTITALKRSVYNLLAILLLSAALALPVCAQSGKAEPDTKAKSESKAGQKAPEVKIDTSKFIIFIHAGTDTKQSKDDKTVRLIAGALFAKGYVVRAPDDDQDEVGGPGVDYFDETAKDAAQDVAATVNDTFAKLDIPRDAKKILNPRRVTAKTKNPPNWLGVWLF
jgi:hypothetical protein